MFMVSRAIVCGFCGALLASICLSTLFAQTTQYPRESASGLVGQFENTTVFWKQFDVAKKIVGLHDNSVLPRLEPWLRSEDMRRRGNAAFVFAKLGDDRGFQVIKAILEDRSSERAVFEIDSGGHPSPGRQIRADRYYVAHLFGDLRDARAVPILIPLLEDKEINLIVPCQEKGGSRGRLQPVVPELEQKQIPPSHSAAPTGADERIVQKRGWSLRSGLLGRLWWGK